MSRDDDFGLLNHLDELMGELHDNVPKALKAFNVDGIHDARVATRRLKAAMRLLEPVLSEGRRADFEKVLKKIRRRLGPLRDLDVMIDHLRKLTSHPVHGACASWLMERLEQRRQDERRASDKLDGSADVLSRLGAWWHVREQIIDARDSMDSLLAGSLHLQLDEFAERAGGIVRQAEAAADSKDRQDPHELRIAGKLLRYTLELADSEGHQLPPAVLRQFKQMQQQLGSWHDDVVLMQCAMRTSIEEMLAYHDLAMQERVVELCRFFLRAAARELSSFARLWIKRGPEVTRTVRERFPLGAPLPVTESKTDPDPPGSDEPSAPAAAAREVASGV